ncbi:hypothetical protein L6452_33857 [Arctium lappa]|uniref:Uncharacterized protein n=1 Tax=Arctium lappa TaxID=4217 RepID=A0ACB8YHK0_ARCLA|nr:hypothetical protein L6452_33857 [Arctium lappa]
MRSFGNPYPVKFLYKDFTSSDSSILPCIDIFLGFIMPKAHLRNSFFVKSIQCVEARGFIFGPPIALAIGAKFVPMRKPNKLPGAVISEEYSLEYGTDIMEMHVGAVQAGERVLVIDDLIATGGTLVAAMKLLERVGASIVECACVIELPDLKVQSVCFLNSTGEPVPALPFLMNNEPSTGFL